MKSKNETWSFEDWLLLFGGVWLINKLFDSTTKAAIGALPKAIREFAEYADTDGNSLFDKELKKSGRQVSGIVIRLIIEARLLPEIALPMFERYPGEKYLWGVIRDMKTGYRIFVSILPDGRFVLLSFYKKQSEKTPKNEIEKARQRAKEVAELQRYR